MLGTTTFDERLGVIEVATDGTAAAVTEMLGRLEAAKTPAAKLSVHRPSLDDVFLSLTDKERDLVSVATTIVR